jgi:hypothetical protein
MYGGEKSTTTLGTLPFGWVPAKMATRDISDIFTHF